MQCMFQFWLLQFPLESGTVLEGSRGGGSFGRLEGSGQVCDSALFLAMVVAKTQLWSLHIRFLLIIQTGLLQASKGKRGEVQPNSPSLCLAGAPGCAHITGLQHFFLSPLFPSPFLDRYNTFRCSDIQISWTCVCTRLGIICCLLDCSHSMCCNFNERVQGKSFISPCFWWNF